MTETHIGLLVIAIPALLIGGILLGRWRPVLWMYLAALVVGLWYLTGTGAVDDVGRQAMAYIPKSAPAAAPEPAAASTPEPSAAPEAAPEAAPTPEAAPEPTPESEPAPAP